MKRALAEGKVSVEAMADDIGYERRALSRWMGDKGPPPRPAVLRRWAMKCGVPYSWLIGQEPDDASDVPTDGFGYIRSAATFRRLTAAA